MKQALQKITKNNRRTKGHSKSLKSIHHSGNDMGRRFKNVWPYMIQKMNQSILTAVVRDTQGQMLDGSTCRLAMNQVTIHEGIFQQRCHCVNVIFCKLANIFTQEGQTL